MAQILLLIFTFCIVFEIHAQSPQVRQNNSDMSIWGGNPQRTRVFDAGPSIAPKSLAWKTDRLYFTHAPGQEIVTNISSDRWISALQAGARHGLGEMVRADGVIYFTVYTDDGFIYARDEQTGKDLWQLKFKGEFISPLTIVNGSIYTVTSAGTVYALDAASGRERWKVTRNSRWGFRGSSPLVIDNSIYFSLSEVPNDMINRPNSELVALDVLTGSQKWVTKYKGRLTSPAYAEGAIYFGSSEGYLYALNIADGRQKWKLKNSGGSVTQPAVAGESVYFSSDNGTIHAIDTKSGIRHWKNSSEPAATFLAISDGSIFYVGESNRIYAIDSSTGKRKWESGLAKQCNAPVVANNVVYVSCGDKIKAIDAKSGAEMWNMDKLVGPVSMLLLSENGFYFIDGNARLYAAK